MNIDHGKDSGGDLGIGFAVADRHKRLSRADVLGSYLVKLEKGVQ